MASETFDVLIAALGFTSAAIRNTAQTRVTNFLAARPRFRDEAPTFNRVTTKYGGVAGLGITLRMSSRADADALWTEISDAALGVVQPGGWIVQNSVTFDSVENTQNVTLVHRRSFPADPQDF